MRSGRGERTPERCRRWDAAGEVKRTHREIGSRAAFLHATLPVIASDSEAIQTEPQLETHWIASLRSQSRIQRLIVHHAGLPPVARLFHAAACSQSSIVIRAKQSVSSKRRDA